MKLSTTFATAIAVGFLFIQCEVDRVHAASATLGTLYGTDGNGGNLLTINRNTGVATLVGNMGIGGVPSLSVDPITGIMYAGGGGGNPDIYTVNPANGATTLVGASSLGFSSIGGLDFRADGTLFAAVNILGNGRTGADHLAALDTLTGVAVIIGPFGNIVEPAPFPADGTGSSDLEGIEAIAFSPTGVLYGASSTRGAAGLQSTLFTIDLLTGAATPLALIANSLGDSPSGGVVSLQFASDGTLYGGTARAQGEAADGGFLITINPTTGLFDFVGGVSATGGVSLGGLAAENIPEPSTLLLGTMASLGLMLRRRKQIAA